MKNPGVFAVSRAIFDHEMFDGEPYGEREAWMWMIGAAAWRSMRVRVCDHLIELKRGELAFSIRFMAQRFGWSKSRVHRFIARLEREGMIAKCSKSGTGAGQQPNHAPTHLKVCNYNKYAFDGTSQRDSDETQIGTGAGQERDKEEKLLDVKNTNRREGTTEKLISEGAYELAEAFRGAAGIDPDDPKWIGVPYRAQSWLTAGWPKSLIVSTTKRVMAGRPAPPHLNYFEKAFASAFADLHAPVPIGEPGGSNGKHRQQARTVSDSARDLRATLSRRLDDLEREEAIAERNSGDGSGGVVVRMLPKG